jgi:hypothetical protein
MQLQTEHTSIVTGDKKKRFTVTYYNDVSMKYSSEMNTALQNKA